MALSSVEFQKKKATNSSILIAAAYANRIQDVWIMLLKHCIPAQFRQLTTSNPKRQRLPTECSVIAAVITWLNISDHESDDWTSSSRKDLKSDERPKGAEPLKQVETSPEFSRFPVRPQAPEGSPSESLRKTTPRLRGARCVAVVFWAFFRQR